MEVAAYTFKKGTPPFCKTLKFVEVEQKKSRKRNEILKGENFKQQFSED